MRKPSPTSRRPRAKKPPTETVAVSTPAPPSPEAQVRTARAATEAELAGIVRATQGQPSAEGFWKAAGRLAKLR